MKAAHFAHVKRDSNSIQYQHPTLVTQLQPCQSILTCTCTMSCHACAVHIQHSTGNCLQANHMYMYMTSSAVQCSQTALHRQLQHNIVHTNMQNAGPTYVHTLQCRKTNPQGGGPRLGQLHILLLQLVVKELTLVAKVAGHPWWVHECGFSRQ